MSEPAHWFESNPLLFKTAVFYEIHLRGFFDGNDDGSGDFRGLIDKLDYLQWLGVDCIWLLPMYASPLRDGGYDIADYNAIHPDYGTVEDFRAFVEASHQRGMRVIADLVVGPGCRAVLLAPLLQPPARPQLRQPRGPGGNAQCAALLARPRHRRLPPRRRSVPLRARRDERREPRRDARVPQACAVDRRRRVPRPRAPGGGESMARGRRRVLRRRRRVPHGLPLPGHAPDVHGAAARGGSADHRDPRPDAADPRQRAVGPLPAEPRRAHARDGHRRRAGLHVHRVRQGPAYAAQPRDQAAPGAAARQRPGRDRADDGDPVLAAGFARPLLRGRDRDGRQHLPRRPRRRPDADAVDRRPERRLLARRLRPALPAAADGPGLGLPGHQRRGAAPHADVAASLDAPLHRAAEGASGVRARDVRVAAAREHEDLRPDPPLGGRHRPGRPQRRALGAGGRARPVTVRRPCPGGDVRPFALPGDRGAALPAHARTKGVLLVPAEAAGVGMSRIEGLVGGLREEDLSPFMLGQRWFGSKSREVAHVTVAESTSVREDEPGLALALVEVRFHPGTHELYHVPVGVRSGSSGWGEGRIAEVDGFILYDATFDPELAAEVASLMREQRTLKASDGATIEFRSVSEVEDELDRPP